LDAVAGVRHRWTITLKDHPDMRVIERRVSRKSGRRWATPKGAARRTGLCAHFRRGDEGLGFVADSLKRSGQVAPVAPPAS